MQCDACSGTGAKKGTSIIKCTACAGRGTTNLR